MLATAICILSGIILLCVGVIAYLVIALTMAWDRIQEDIEGGLDIPPIKWDYTVESGWVDAESEDE